MKKENYLILNGAKINLSDSLLDAVKSALEKDGKHPLKEKKVGEIATIGEYEFIVLEHSRDTTALILKSLLVGRSSFSSKNNDYRQSNVLKILSDIAVKIEKIVGADNLIEHKVDLTSDDGLRDYGVIREKISLLTTDLYRRYIEVLDRYKIDEWWWLATPHSTKRHENDQWVKCVSPRGYIYNDFYYNDYGVRPFCILKSDILVS